MSRLRIEGILSDSDKEKIHNSAVGLLEKTGYMCNQPELLEAFRRAGCKIGEELPKPKGARIVRFTEAIVMEALKKAPARFTLSPICPGYKGIEFGGEEVSFGTNASDWILDLDTDELRKTTLADFVTGSRLIDACSNFDVIFGFPCYWMHDIVKKEEYEKYGYVGALMAGVTMLHCGKAQNRVYFAADQQELNDVINLWYMAAGGEKAFRSKPCGSINLCLTSPYCLLTGTDKRILDWAEWAVVCTKAGVPIRIEPAGLLGLSAPVTVAGGVTQATAEFLAVNVVIQAIDPGHPVVMSEYSGSADMVTGSKVASRPEAMLQRLGIITMAKYYNKPSGFYMQSDASMADSQAAWEHLGLYLMALLAGVNLTMSGGAFCSADIMSFRQIVIDDEMIGWARRLANGFLTNQETIPVDLMMETGMAALGGTFLGSEHTKRLFKTEMWQRSSVTNAYLRDAWVAKGKKPIGERAAERARALLKKHEPKIPQGFQQQVRQYLLEAMKREGVKDDQAKKVIEKTYWSE